uniref:Uncharacterized protein n=1 Tax=Cacopsylla melanoneura TaxID=428564 RepID=A0A8D8ZIQ2_9HEMI
MYRRKEKKNHIFIFLKGKKFKSLICSFSWINNKLLKQYKICRKKERIFLKIIIKKIKTKQTKKNYVQNITESLELGSKLSCSEEKIFTKRQFIVVHYQHAFEAK